MKSSENYRLVLVTCANPIQAKLIARSVVEKRLAACVNILRSPIESHYRWQGKVEKARELLLLIKTTARKLGGLEREVKRLHSYDMFRNSSPCPSSPAPKPTSTGSTKTLNS